MIELFDGDIHEEGRQSSKGNQLKWFSGDTWYKADYTGYEGLAEYVVSALLQKSCLAEDDFVRYDRADLLSRENFQWMPEQKFSAGRRAADHAGEALSESIPRQSLSLAFSD